jgi:hypothetical protein
MSTLTTTFFLTLDIMRPIIGNDLAVIVAAYIRTDQYTRWNSYIRSGDQYWHESFTVNSYMDWSISARSTTGKSYSQPPLEFTFTRYPHCFAISQDAVWMFMCGWPLWQAGKSAEQLRAVLRHHFADLLEHE